MRLLVVEDEPALAHVLKQGLEDAKYAVNVAEDGQAAVAMVRATPYSAIVLDVMLPKLDGWGVITALRESNISVPVLMLTARDSVRDRVKGLELGADDYLPKPFDFSELIARVNALVRRDRIHKGRVIKVGDLAIDTTQHTVTRSGKSVNLTPREFSLLEALAGHQGTVLSREVILDRVWLDEESTSNTVDVYIRALRKKIDADSPTKLIHTHHGFGYSIQLPQSEESHGHP